MFIYEGKTNLFDHSYTKELAYLINQSYEENKKPSQATNFSYKLEKFLTQRGILELLEILNCIFSLIIAIFYIISTYTTPETNKLKKKLNKLINIIDIILFLYFIIHYILRIYCSQNRLINFFELLNIVDLVTIICLIISKQDFVKRKDAGYYLNGAKMIRILYLFKFENILQKRTNEQNRYLYRVALTLISIVFISNALLLELENDYIRENLKDEKLYTFHDILYFEIITLTTVGLGDITPRSDNGRLTIIITVIITIAMVPALNSKISMVFSLQSKYSRIKYEKKLNNYKHLVLLGNCSEESFLACLDELYHEDHANIDFDTIIMQKKPNEKILKFFNNKKYFNKIFYLVGDVLNYQDLERTKINNSICTIILANKIASNYRQEDFNNIMKAFSIVKYSNMLLKNKNKSKKTRVLLQLMLPETKEIYFSSLYEKKNIKNNSDIQIICLEEIKLQLLGKSCLCQGINTIIAMLITSKKPKINIGNNDDMNNKWMKEYLIGLENEIYCIKIKCEYLHNMSFNDLVKIIYELTEFIVIGTDVIHQELKPFVCLNPFNYKFSPFDHFIYLIASRQPNEDEINNLLDKYLESNKKGIIENNIEMVKIKRSKKSYWANLNRSFKYEDNSDENNSNINTNLDNNNELINTDFNISFQEKNININISSKEQEILTTSNYHTFISSIRPRAREESEFFNYDILINHIIICGMSQNIKHLILPLRTRDKLKYYPILIIDKEEHIPYEIWSEIHYFPDIYYMQGDPIKNEDLIKGRINKSQAVVILSDYYYHLN